MKKIILLIIALILITLLVSAYGSETVPSGEKQETAGLTVDITDLTEEPMFIDAEADGIAMQLIYQTSVCPLARVIRSECRKRKIKHLKVVYSTEKPVRPLEDPAISCRSHCICPPGTRKCTVRRDIPGSTAFVPSVAGLIIAGEVIKDLAGYGKDERNNI